MNSEVVRKVYDRFDDLTKIGTRPFVADVLTADADRRVLQIGFRYDAKGRLEPPYPPAECISPLTRGDGPFLFLVVINSGPETIGDDAVLILLLDDATRIRPVFTERQLSGNSESDAAEVLVYSMSHHDLNLVAAAVKVEGRISATEFDASVGAAATLPQFIATLEENPVVSGTAEAALAPSVSLPPEDVRDGWVELDPLVGERRRLGTRDAGRGSARIIMKQDGRTVILAGTYASDGIVVEVTARRTMSEIFDLAEKYLSLSAEGDRLRRNAPGPFHAPSNCVIRIKPVKPWDRDLPPEVAPQRTTAVDVYLRQRGW